METIADLLFKLREPGVDMFEHHRYRREITGRGAKAVRELLDHTSIDAPLVEGLLRDALKEIKDAEREAMRHELELRVEPNRDPTLRKVCIRLLASQYPDVTDIGQRLLNFAADHERETREMRAIVLQAVSAFKPSVGIGMRLLNLLRDSDPQIVLSVLSILPAYVGVLEAEQVGRELEGIMGPTAELSVRCSAIQLVGYFGEIDVLERVCLLPLTHEREHSAVHVMVRHLLSKPRRVTRLNPKSFEHLTQRLIEKMGYESVIVQHKGSWDEGVDVTAFYDEDRLKGRERFKMIGQCKRYQRSNMVGPDVVSTMVESLKAKEAGRGVIITTSDFLRSARELAQKHKQIELINGEELQRLLNTYFAVNLYKIGD